MDVDVDKAKLTTPITTDEGDSLTEGVKSVTWTVSADKGIEAGSSSSSASQSGSPTRPRSAFPAVQTYDERRLKSTSSTGATGDARRARARAPGADRHAHRRRR